MPESQQPQLIISLSGGYLVFIGLIVAASATVLASDRASQAPDWARAALLSPLIVSIGSGIAALIAANAAHNLGRRNEKLSRPNLTAQQATQRAADAQVAREFASRFIYWSLTGAIIASVLLFLTMIPIVFARKSDAEEAAGQTTAVAVRTSVAFEWLGDIKGFRLAESEPAVGDFARSIVGIRHRWCSTRTSGQDGVMLVIGSTDRVPLRGSALQRYESNLGLAQARAISAANLLFPDQKPKSMIIFAAGPAMTPAEPPRPPASGFEHDRKVSVWAFWRPSDATARQPVPECAD